jgi:hypothetical protein
MINKMNLSFRFLAAMLLTIAATCSQAQQNPGLMGDLFRTDKHQWHQIDTRMSPHRYQAAAKNNQRLLRKSAQQLLENGMTAFGLPKEGIMITGAVVGLAIDGGKFHLNESKTLALELDEMVSEDRALTFKLKLRW